ncbi:methylmalonyl Co-A mutase-associated GTPase MeaB [Hymenobacter busanensis]|uniref:Methylmalonyl Co-A mutase-associated GTPase MeaB n=1 Tax=Hymenobacter busanensis TaxID=2607656 RepID=A0A7L5A0B4_9BACT|nr:methylmalonyl Co-A mutase-associated GTPase MeaB [Hymenobacter busanensis]KAA9338345.1 methylmalonyl Co-A mutase-associated GTPase MeaB [Hymenobacter busanensis]QHJ09229.1 methylmalonyl Co-A mutase-associated GTPase MeaB [Hymenobacter busanensis]
MPKRLSLAQYTDGLLAGNRFVLSRAITLVESTLPADKHLAQQVLDAVLPRTGRSVRLGITGVPGVGKSTFIESLGMHLVAERGHRLAVLAVDPTSQRSGGSILGDKTRMNQLAAHEHAFIRPSPAGRSLGGVARATREALLLCEAAGYDVIFVETVGVGQSETAVHGMVDFFLLLMLAGAGDELQGVKRGIMEMADAVVITKADSGNELAAKRARREYQSALQLFPHAASSWAPVARTCSALTGEGVPGVWEELQRYLEVVRGNGFFEQRRQEQNLQWLHHSIREALEERFYARPDVHQRLAQLQLEVQEGRRSAFGAAEELLALGDV